MKRSESGFVLINALVLIAALASIAALLLAAAGAGRERLNQSRTATQLTLNLDAYEAFAVLTLVRVSNPGANSGVEKETSVDLPLERGSVAGQIHDMQGLFNVNWLTDPSFEAAEPAFGRLLQALGVSEPDKKVLQDFLRPGGPQSKQAFLGLDPPENPVGGAVLMIQQIQHLPGISERTRKRIQPYLTALPGDSKLNVNSADAMILAAFLPDLSPANLQQIVGARQQNPFESVDSFLTMVGLNTPSDTETEPETEFALKPENLDIQSEWFEAEILATMGTHRAQRRSVLRRQGVPGTATVQWRLTTRP